VLLRPGAITREEIEAVAGPLAEAGDAIQSPGQLASHYAPKAALRLNAAQARPDEALLGFGAAPGASLNLSPQGDLKEAAANLFAMLRTLDKQARAIAVSPIPGPSAILAALSASGLPTDAFSFRGFFAPKRARNRDFLEQMRGFPGTLVAYEAPHRVLETLEDIAEVLGPRPVVLARELTKVHEEFLRGTAAEIREILAKRPSVKGEIVLMIGRSETAEVDDTPLEAAVEKLVEAGLSRMEAFKTVARQRGISKREVYKKLNER